MAVGSTYPITVADDNGETRLDGNLIFADSTNQPAPSANSIVSGTALAISGLTGSTVASRYVGQTATGSPASGAHLLGDFVTTTDGHVFVCSVAGTPGTWLDLTALAQFPKGLAGQVLQGVTPSYAYPPGFEIAYDQITSGVNVASTTEGTPTAIIAGTSHTYEAVPYVAEFFSPQVTDSSAAAGTVTILFIADGASIGRLAVLDSVTATTQILAPVTGKLRFTPTAAAHTYGISAFASSATGTPAVGAGAGGINTLAPAYVRITKA